MNIVPENFKRRMSLHDKFVAELPIEDVQRVLVEANDYRRTAKLGDGLLRELGDLWAKQYWGKDQEADTGVFDKIEEACCRRLAFAMLGVSSVPEPTEEETYYRGEANDGSFWYISRSAVVADMIEHEEADDKWPRPITDEMVENWLGDNAPTIEGWKFDCIEAPRDDAVMVLHGEEHRAPRIGR